MNFKSRAWFPVGVLLAAINLVAVPIYAANPMHATSHAVLAVLFGIFAARQRRSAPAPGDIATLRQQLDDQTIDLDDARQVLANQSAQLAELQERVDFAERMLIQARERQSLEQRDKR